MTPVLSHVGSATAESHAISDAKIPTKMIEIVVLLGEFHQNAHSLRFGNYDSSFDFLLIRI